MNQSNARAAVSEGDFAFLARVVDGEDGSCSWAFAENNEERTRMRPLARLGLVEIVDPPLAETRCRSTLAGRDLVAEVRSGISKAEAEKRQQQRHDYKVAAFGAVAGGVLGLFSGGLGGWLVTQAIPAIAQALSR